MNEKRELLLEFLAWSKSQYPTVTRPPGEPEPYEGDPEGFVDEFLAARGGALGHSEDEIKGTARDATFEVLVDGVPLTYEVAAAKRTGDGAGRIVPCQFDIASGLPKGMADGLSAWLTRIGVEHEVKRDDLSRPARMN